jgi:hypothetical protein
VTPIDLAIVTVLDHEFEATAIGGAILSGTCLGHGGRLLC